MTTLSRMTSLMAVIAMLLTLTAVPASAAAQGSATITTGDLLSGQDGLVNVRVTNNAMPLLGSSIDAFVIEVPQDLVSVAAADIALPDGWTGGYDDEVGFIFGEATGSGLAPGSSLDVGIGVSALIIPDDRTRGFTTSVSDNGGRTLSSAGSPQVTSRILELITTRVIKPATATNTDASQVTARQDTAYVHVVAKNHGSESRQVKFDVARTTGESSLSSTSPRSIAVDPGMTKSRAIWVTFGNAGNLTIQGVATTTNSAAKPGKDVAVANLTVQPAFAANLVEDSLQPRGVAQGSTTDIQYRINKTAGAQPVTGDATFSFGGFSVTDAQSFDAANGNKTVLFPAVTIPDLANGDYDTTSTITGVDANGANVSLTLAPGTLTLDNLLPVVSFNLDVGPSDVENTTPATTNGRSITYSGSISLSEDNGTCGNCSITEAVLVAQPSGTELPMNVTNDNGTLSGRQSFTFPEGTTSAFARITATRDSSGISGDTVSNTVPVDLVIPGIDEPGRTMRTEDGDKIIISLGDDGGFLDADGTRALDWSVDNNTVLSIGGNPSRSSASELVLNLKDRLPDNATPTVSYNHTAIIGGVIHDRVSQNMFDQTVNTIDGIAPAAPVILGIDDLGKQDGEYWTNNSAPKVALSNLAAGNVLEIFYDTNDDGEPQESERVYNQPVNGSTATVTLADLGNVNRSHELLARMTDNAGNVGTIASDVLNLDFTKAEIVNFIADGQNVTVVFDEPVVRGRDAAFDWAVQATQDGTTAFRTVTQVAVGADSTERVLTINSDSYDGSASDAQVLAVRYKFRGAEGERYEDRATNLFDDVLFTKD